MNRIRVGIVLLCLAPGLPGSFLVAQTMTPGEREPVRVYPVDRRVADLPADEDFSRPERAYAAIHRRLVMGDSDWRGMSVERLVPVLPRPTGPATPLGERAARGYLEARIIEVRMVAENIAYVIAQWPASGSYDVRCLEIENGKWLNASNHQANTLDAARKIVEDAADTRRDAQRFRLRRALPQEHLDRFATFLSTSTEGPREFMIRNLATHRLVLYGRVPGRPAYSQLLVELVNDPTFNRHVGVVFMSFPANLQPQVDRFVGAESPDPALLLSILRDTDWMGTPDPGVFDLCMAIATANKPLPVEKRIRIVFVDQQRPWHLLRQPADLRPYDGVRESTLANNVLRHFILNPGETRNALFILDMNQAVKGLRWRSDDSPIRSAGWRIADVLGEQCFSISEHTPQISERGSVSGRAARGLFDSAFSSAGFKAAAFAMANSPFGTEPFDASTDLDSSGLFQDAFDGYITLGRLDDEAAARLIDNFYTDDVLKEADRRHKLLFGRTLAEEIGFEEVDLERFTRWLGRNWGGTRDWKDHMGSIDAWRTGNNEEMQ